MRFGVYGRPMNKIKADNILPGLGWIIKNGSRATLRVLLSDGRTNFNEDAESTREVYVTL